MYNPADWFWAGEPDSRTSEIIYSSSAGKVVPADDAVYVAWSDAGNSATPWPKDATGAVTSAALDDILIAAGLPATGLAVMTTADLAAYANAKQWALATGGHAVTIGGVPHLFATNVESMTLMDGKVSRLSQPNPPASFNWQLDSGFVNIPAAEFVVAATSCADFVQATFDVLFPMLAEIAAGTITTTAQIDAAAWPT